LAAGISTGKEARAESETRERAAAPSQFRFLSLFEGQTVRTPVGVALVIVCLGLTGCSLFGKKQAARNNNNSSNTKPFLGTEGPAKEETAAVPASSGGPLPRANGFVAGQVVALSTGRPVMGARIQVQDLEEDDSKKATLEAETLEGGYFTIEGLKVGRHYKLIARAEQGGEMVSQAVFVQPPKPNLYLQLSKHNTTPSTPPVPDPPKLPGKKDVSGTESSHERTPSATTLDPPVKIDPGKGSAPFREGESRPPPDNGMGASGGNSGNISNIAQEFPRTPAPRPQTEDVSIPNPSKSGTPDGPQSYRSAPWPQPPAPQWERIPDERRPRSTTPAAPPSPSESVRIPSIPTKVPSCVLLGNKLDNFALNDVDGRTWEYKRDFHGQLLLLDFWYHTCSPCLQAIPRLNALQREYGPYGLQVVGIACETGTLEEQRSHVRSVRGRYNINYTTLLSGGGPERCEVIKQFQVTYYPKLVLIDKSGKIIWQSTDKGMDDYAHEQLKRLIHRQLIQN
jgi:peroxiredoxin